QFGDARAAKPLYFGEPRLRRRDHFGEGAELCQQGLGERLDIAARQRAKQEQLQQFIIGQSLGAGLAEAAAQAFGMTMIMRRGFRPPAATVALLVQAETPAPYPRPVLDQSPLAGGSPPAFD